ncbi:MAG: FecR domain-containing protein [Chthoniobacteraceae bacterium]
MNEPELDALLIRYLDGTLDATSTERLTAELERNAEARAQLRGMAEQAFAVAEAGRCAEARTASQFTMLPRAEKQTRWPGSWPVWAAAALMLLSVGFWWQARTPVLLEVTQVNGAVTWTGADGTRRGALAVGMALPSGTLELETDTALAQVRFADGTLVSLHGRAGATFSDEKGKRVRLRQGAFSAEVKPQPKAEPMRVFTPAAEIVVVGTAFSLEARADETSLDVAHGVVTMRRLADGREASVGRQERLVATLDPQSALIPQTQVQPATVWRMQFAVRPTHGEGEWIAPGLRHARGALAAQPFVAGKERDGRVIVHHGVCVRDDPGIATLTATSELRMKVRTAQDTGLQVIVGTRKPGGGFGGNFEFVRLTCPRSGNDEWRDLSVPVSQLRSITPEYAASAEDLIADFIILNSFTNPAGLEVSELSIVPIP